MFLQEFWKKIFLGDPLSLFSFKIFRMGTVSYTKIIISSKYRRRIEEEDFNLLVIRVLST